MSEKLILTADYVATQPFVLARAGKEKRLNCPFCEKLGKSPDYNKKLYVHVCPGTCSSCMDSTKKTGPGRFQCYRCGTHGVIGDIANQSLLTQNLSTELWDERIYSLFSKTQVDSGSLLPDPIPSAKLPTCVPVHCDIEAISYLSDRGVQLDDVSYFQFHVGVGPKFFGRLIIPDIDSSGNWLFWTGRDYKNLYSFKYQNPRAEEAERAKQVFNLERVDTTRPVYLCEGVFSALTFRRQGMATYGVNISPHQVKRIAAKKFERLYLCYDGGVFNQLIRAARLLHDAGVPVYPVVLPGKKDPADIGLEGMLRLCNNSKLFSLDTEFNLLLKGA